MTTGLAYPLSIDPKTKSLAIASDADYIKGLINSFIETERGERLGLPAYGTPDYTFSAFQTFGFAAADLEKKLSLSIPSASFSVVSNLNDAGEAEINVIWSYDDEEQTAIKFTLENSSNG